MGGPALRDLQAAFWRSIAAMPGTATPDPELLRVVRPGNRLSAADRVDVYAGMYVWRLVEALAEDFPKVAAGLGPEAFGDIVREYLAAHPSTEPSVRQLGRSLPAFLAGREPGWLADLARLEWTRLEVFDAPDAAPVSLEELRRVPPEEWPELRLASVPALACLVTAWPVHELWADPSRAVEPARTALRVWRDGFLVYQAPMDGAEEAALASLVAGEPFAAVCEAVGDPADAAGLLLRWIADGIVLRPSRSADPRLGPLE
jgi:hypothetical protein